MLWGFGFAAGLYVIDRIAADNMKLLSAVLWTLLSTHALFVVPIVRSRYFRFATFASLAIQIVLVTVVAALSLLAGQRLDLVQPWVTLVAFGLALGILAQTLTLLGIIHSRADHEAAIKRIRRGATDAATKRLAASRARTPRKRERGKRRS